MDNFWQLKKDNEILKEENKILLGIIERHEKVRVHLESLTPQFSRSVTAKLMESQWKVKDCVMK